MSSVVVRNPEILSGTPVFAGTRVPVKNLTDSLEGGSTIDEFLDDFPSVRREQVVAFLEDARDVAQETFLSAPSGHSKGSKARRSSLRGFTASP